MKRDFRLNTFGFRLGCGGLLLAAASAFALTENPYTGIVGRNAFALKPPTPTITTTAPPIVAPPGIELQGISTILGRPQVLLKIKSPPKPPEGAKEQSFIMAVDDREGEVSVLSIDPVNGVVRLKNQGNDLTLSMAENAAKPAVGPAIPGATTVPPRPGMIPTPTGGGVPPPASGAGGINLPTRQLRSVNSGADAVNEAGGVGAMQNAQQQPTTQRLEANVALYEANRLKNEELIKAGARIPRLPMHSLLKQSPAENSQP